MCLTKIKYYLASILCFVTFNVDAKDWSTLDQSLLAAAGTLHIIDWAQTRTIAKNPDLYYERNPLLGRHPSTAEVNRHFALGLIVIPVLAHYFSDYRTQILSTWLAVEVLCVGNNVHLGIRTTF